MSKYRATFMLIGDKRYKIPAQLRKIGGENWRYYMWSKNKAEAEKEAKRQTDSYGLLTKVVRSMNGWAIYFKSR